MLEIPANTPCRNHVEPAKPKPEAVVLYSKEVIAPPKTKTPRQTALKEESTNSSSISNSCNKARLRETVPWSTLPSSLLKHRKEMLRRRNLASYVAAEAQREASEAAILVKCLSMFADLCSSAATKNPEPTLNKFFRLHHLVTQPYAAAPPNDKSNDRNKSTRRSSLEYGETTLKFLKPSMELSGVDKLEWAKGDGPKEIKEIRENLLNETQSWFLKFLEGALDSCSRMGKRDKKVKDNDVAVTLSLLKQANEWLDEVNINHSSAKNGIEDTVERLKEKLHACLIAHVDSVASALQNRSDHG